MKLPYVPPTLKKAPKMVFPIDVIQANGKRIVCKQCSSCHGCR